MKQNRSSMCLYSSVMKIFLISGLWLQKQASQGFMYVSCVCVRPVCVPLSVGVCVCEEPSLRVRVTGLCK